MKKYILPLFLIILFTLGGIYLASQQQTMMKHADTMMASPTSAMTHEDNMMKKDSMTEGSMMDTTRYMPYTQGILAKDTEKRRVLFFYANWCSETCIPADMDFQKHTSQLPEDVRLIRVNYQDTATDSEEKALADKYGVTYQHTFVQIDEKGNVVTKWNGGQLDELLSHLKNV